jgi:hypothetical protein
MYTMAIQVTLSKEKETQGTWRYRGLKAVGLDKYQIYLSKADVALLGDPDMITLLIMPVKTEVEIPE